MKSSWRNSRLGDLIQVQNGYAFDSKAFSPEGALPLIRIRDLKKGTETQTRYTGEYDERYVVQSGDLLIGMDGEFGCYEWKGPDALLNQRVCRLQGFSGSIEPRFLFFGVNSHLKEIEEVTGFTTVKHLSSKQILSIDFPIPPIDEQKRIVAILDEAFAAIDKAKQNAEKNLQNARELFESYLQKVFSNNKEDSSTTLLGDLCSLITDGKHGDCINEPGSGYYFLSAKDVRSGTLNYEGARQITKADFEETHRRTALKPGDICMVNTGATIGRLALAPNDPRTERTTFQKSVAVIKPIASSLDNSYCSYLLRADLKRLVRVSSGAAVKNLLIGDMKKHVVHVPTSLGEQRSIVGKLDNLSFEIENLEVIYSDKVSSLQSLKKSILQKAFNGELK